MTVRHNWRATFARIKAALMRRGRSEQDADDLLQDAWVRLAHYKRRDVVERPEAFLMRTALNLSIDGHRTSQSRGEQVMLEDVVLLDAAPSAEQQLLARERLARLSTCLARLTPKTRTIFLAHRIDGKTYQQIALEHQLAISTVEQHVAKAMLQLTTWMEGW